MQNYYYSARSDKGKLIHGTLMALDETDLANKISASGCFLIRYKIIAANQSIAAKSDYPKISSRQILNFTFHLSAFLNAGIPLIRALRDLEKDCDNSSLRRVLENICNRIESGSSLREALSYHPKSFSNLYIAIVGAGENTGKLPDFLNNLTLLLDWQMEIKAKIKEAATYPLILFFVMLAVVALLVIKVIPSFEPLFKESSTQLPLPTQIVLNSSYFARSFWYIPFIALFIFIAGYKFYNSTPKGKYLLDSLKLKIPLFGGLIQKIALSRFCHTMAIGLKSGVNILTALEFSQEVTNNRRIETAVSKAKDAVTRGEKLAESLAEGRIFPSLVIRMIAVGEQTGALPQTLSKASEFYDREVPAAIKKIFSLFEPIMIIVMGIVVGGIALSIFLPMFQMVQLISG